jgi:hypothetical protein
MDYLTYRVPRRHVPTMQERIVSLQLVVAEQERENALRQERERRETVFQGLVDQARQNQTRFDAARHARADAVREVHYAILQREFSALYESSIKDTWIGIGEAAAVLFLIVLFWRGRFLRRQGKILDENNGLLADAFTALALKGTAIQQAEARIVAQAEAHHVALATVEADAGATILAERETLKTERAEELNRVNEQARRDVREATESRERIEAQNQKLQARLDEASMMREKLADEKAIYDQLAADIAKLECEMAGCQSVIAKRIDLPNNDTEIIQLRMQIGSADQRRLSVQHSIQEVSQLLATDFERVTGLPYTTESLTPILHAQMKDMLRVRADAEAAKETYTVLDQRRNQRISDLTLENFELKKTVESTRAENDMLKRRQQTSDDAKSMLLAINPREIARSMPMTDPLALDTVGTLERGLGFVVYQLLEALKEDSFFPMKRATQVDFVHLALKEIACCECRVQIPLMNVYQHFLASHGGTPVRHRLLTDPMPRPG